MFKAGLTPGTLIEAGQRSRSSKVYLAPGAPSERDPAAFRCWLEQTAPSTRRSYRRRWPRHAGVGARTEGLRHNPGPFRYPPSPKLVHGMPARNEARTSPSRSTGPRQAGPPVARHKAPARPWWARPQEPVSADHSSAVPWRSTASGSQWVRGPVRHPERRDLVVLSINTSV